MVDEWLKASVIVFAIITAFVSGSFQGAREAMLEHRSEIQAATVAIERAKEQRCVSMGVRWL